MKRVAVLGVQVPFVRGGAEMLVDGLVDAVNRLVPDARAELIQLPFRWYPDHAILDGMMAWRLIDVTESDGHRIDLVVALKFPAWLAQSDRKVCWLSHQHRVFYDLEDSQYDLPAFDRDHTLRARVRQLDTATMRGARACFSTSHTVAERLARYNGVESEVVYPPSLHGGRIVEGPYGDYILYVGRVEPIKRVEMLVEALAHAPGIRVRIVGSGRQLEALCLRAAALGVAARCELTGYASDGDLVRHLAGARAVFYGPVDEDYGFVAAEALQAGKPLVTFSDSGEVRRLVDMTGAGWVCAPTAEALAETLETVRAEPAEALRRRAAPGRAFALGISWENVVSRIIVPFL